MTQVTMRQLLEAGAHFGHRTRYWNPHMAPYIFGARNKIHIINLEQTLPLLKEAYNSVSRTAASGGRVMFVGTKRSARDVIRSEAERCDMPYVNHRWLGGMLTNFKTVKQSIKRMEELEEQINNAAKYKFNKKESLMMQREYDKLNRSLQGIRNMTSLPDALFVVDVGYESIAIKEARKLGIPIIAVVDTNNSPDGVDTVIPGNDDATRAIKVYAGAIADAVLAGRGSVTTARKAKAAEKAEAKAKVEAPAAEAAAPEAAAAAPVAEAAPEAAAVAPAAAAPEAAAVAPAADAAAPEESK
ncbi:MAG: 30S ribosomal protein S2 [Oceanococcus sp.]